MRCCSSPSTAGLDAVTADDIAAAANVSVRTFHNYFGSKEEALISAWRSQFEVHLDELRARPADEPILVSLERVFAGIAAQIVEHPADAASQCDLLWTSTVMAHRRSVLLDEAVRMLTDIVAARTGTDAATDIYPHLVTVRRDHGDRDRLPVRAHLLARRAGAGALHPRELRAAARRARAHRAGPLTGLSHGA